MKLSATPAVMGLVKAPSGFVKYNKDFERGSAGRGGGEQGQVIILTLICLRGSLEQFPLMRKAVIS